MIWKHEAIEGPIGNIDQAERDRLKEMTERIRSEFFLIATYRASRIATDLACALLIISGFTLVAEWLARRKDRGWPR